ncbi:MAG: DUF2061 domain-containing protein [Candidatus Glassbacteria bacterium]
METIRRSMVKSISYRLLGLAITGTIVWLVTGKLAVAATIGLIDTVVKLGCYYAHERVWNKIGFGKIKPPEYEI